MYSLLKCASRTPRMPVAFTPDLLVPGFWAVDLETTGTDPCVDRVVGIGLANESACFYVDLTQPSQDLRALGVFLRASTFTAFNALFDGVFLQQLIGEWPRVVGCSYGLFKQASGEGFAGQSWSLETLQREVLGWTTSNKTALEAALAERGLTKAQLSQLPAEILGPYCASDADAAWQGWHELQAQAPQHLKDFHARVFVPQLRLLAEQQLRGMYIDRPGLQEYYTGLLSDIDHAMTTFLSIPDVANHISLLHESAVDAWKASQPPQRTKTGGTTARWQKWAASEPATEDVFNPNSKLQLAELFYGTLGYKPLRHTPTGRAVVDRKALPSLGEPGRALLEYNLLVKRRGYVAKVLERCERDGLVHPQFNSVGTVTGRLGGSGGLNLQQMPKVAGFLQHFAARPGHVLVQADAEALEPTILAEFSQDATLLSVYGPDAPPNDIYLLVAARCGGLGTRVREYYNPAAPTKEGIALAKKHCKRERGIAKVCKLAYDYGAGAPKIHETLVLGGVDISLREVREIRKGLDELFVGIRRFEQRLTDIWEASGGWIPSAYGTPICVARPLLKDILNRFCQTSGHQFLQSWVAHIDRLRRDRGIEMYPWLEDLHDETIWECPEPNADLVVAVFDDALKVANDTLGMGIRIKGPAMVVKSLAEIKDPDGLRSAA